LCEIYTNIKLILADAVTLGEIVSVM